VIKNKKKRKEKRKIGKKGIGGMKRRGNKEGNKKKTGCYGMLYYYIIKLNIECCKYLLNYITLIKGMRQIIYTNLITKPCHFCQLHR